MANSFLNGFMVNGRVEVEKKEPAHIACHITELPQKAKEAILNAKMSSEYDYLNDLMDDE